MTDLPESWVRVALRDLGRWQGGGTPSKAAPHYWGGPIPWVSPKDMKSTIIRGSIDGITEAAVSNSAASVVAAGSILVVTRSGILAHSLPVAINAVDVTVNQDLKALTPLADLVPEYLALAFRANERAILNECVKDGTTVHSIEMPALADYEIPLAPLPEQHRIVAKIEALFSELDKAVESLTLARAQLKTYRQALLKHAFEGKLTADWRSPNMRWRNTTIGDEIVFLTSGSRGWADYYADEGETFIRAQNLKHDRLDLADIAYVKLPAGNSEGMRTRVKVGDVLVTITGANVTKTGILTQDIGTAYVSQHVALCRPGDAILPEFLYWYLLAETGGRRQLNESAYGAGKPGLNLENIREVSIALPEREEQIEIVARINSSLSIEENLRHMVETELQRVSALRQSILKQAFSGQLVAQDPADEPASALLARLRGAAPIPKTRRKKTA